MAISRRRLARSLADQLLSGVSVQTIAPRLAAYIIDGRMQPHTDQLLDDIAYELAARGDVIATVTTARPLTDELRDAVYEFVKHRETQATIQLNETVDPSIIGGVIIETPHSRYDASVRRSINQLKMT